MSSIVLASKNSNQVNEAATQTGNYKAKKKAKERNAQGVTIT